jgi:stalled ribosome rescue protein Dom34
MKHNDQKQFAGVWVDHKNAFIITKGDTGYAVKERVEAPSGFEAESEHHRNNAKHSDLLSYFKSLSGHLLGYDQILLFGTGVAQEQFQNYLKEDTKFRETTVTIENTGHLTDHQMIAKVREFFN